MAAVPLTDIEPLQNVLSARPLGLFSDIDGTLSPIVERPEEATVTPRCRNLLKRLTGEGVRVALITGRTLEVARSMVKIDEAAYAANHGLEYWFKGRVEWAEGVDEFRALVEQVLAETTQLEVADVQVERKGPGVAFHYRRAPDAEAARAAILHAMPLSDRIDEAAYAANHGLEYWFKGRVEWAEGVDEFRALVEQVLAETTQLEVADVQVERKGPGVAFHYRRAPDAEAARAAILHAMPL